MYSILSSLERIEKSLVDQPQYRGLGDIMDFRGSDNVRIPTGRFSVMHFNNGRMITSSNITTVISLSTFSICITHSGTAYLLDNELIENVPPDVTRYNIPEAAIGSKRSRK